MKRYAMLVFACSFLPTQHCTSVNGEPTTELRFNLLICLYNETNERRANEYIYCLRKNLANPSIKQIHVSYDTSCDSQRKRRLLRWLQARNVAVSYQDRRQTFGDCMRLANELFPNDYVILSNADIYFDKTLLRLKHKHINGKFLAITRSIAIKNKIRPQENHFSQDTWIFKTPFHNTALLDRAYVGRWFCETHICHAVAEHEKLKLFNPCLDIHCMHKHDLRAHRSTKANRHLGNEFAPPHCTLRAPLYARRNQRLALRKRVTRKKDRCRKGLT